MKLLTDIELIEKNGDRGFYVPWLPDKLELYLNMSFLLYYRYP